MKYEPFANVTILTQGVSILDTCCDAEGAAARGRVDGLLYALQAICLRNGTRKSENDDVLYKIVIYIGDFGSDRQKIMQDRYTHWRNLCRLVQERYRHWRF